MNAFTSHTGLVATMDRANVDTDQIIPKQFLKRIERTGFGQFLFFDWRFLDDGSPNPEFELNRPEAQGASVLLARRNFGSGSSREHAPWALEDYGFRVIVAPSFADIFYNNCFKNGILPIKVTPEQLELLFDDADRGSNATLTIDLENQNITRPDGKVVNFEMDPFRKQCLLEGLDDIGQTLQRKGKIDGFEERQNAGQPWLYGEAAE